MTDDSSEPRAEESSSKGFARQMPTAVSRPRGRITEEETVTGDGL